jgi:hypothetical protein
MSFDMNLIKQLAKGEKLDVLQQLSPSQALELGLLVKDYKQNSEVAAPPVPPRPDLYLGKYEVENRQYQALLDKRYPAGRIKPVERFITMEANILHHCDKCSQEFYGKPKWLLTRENQRHICTLPYGDQLGNRTLHISGRGNSEKSKIKRKLNPKGVQRIIDLYKSGKYENPNQVARQMNISQATARYHLKKAGLI